MFANGTSTSYSGVSWVASGVDGTCLLKPSGNVDCNGVGYTLLGASGPFATVGTFAAGSNLMSAFGHACIHQPDDSLRCWGQNWAGSLGDGTVTNGAAPFKGPVTPSLTGAAVDVAVGMHFTLARLKNGTLVAWGMNTTGQLGHNPGSDTTKCYVNGNTGTTAGACNPTPSPVVGLP